MLGRDAVSAELALEYATIDAIQATAKISSAANL